MDRDSLQGMLAEGLSVEKIAQRLRKHPSTVSYWLARHGLESPYAPKHAKRGGPARETLAELVAEGLTIAQIAVRVDRSKGTVRHWLRRHGLQTSGGRRGASAADEKPLASPAARRRCERHGDTEFVLEGRGYYRCKRCRTAQVADHRRKLKELRVERAGGCCTICGYSRCMAALQFHHLNPEEKRLQFSWNGLTLSRDAALAEAQKCVLLCANCHAEVEAGAAVVPLEFLPAGRDRTR